MNAATFRVGWLARRPVAEAGPSVERAAAWFTVAAASAILLTLSRPGFTPPNVVAVLVALAAFCVSALTVRRAPSLAWLAAIGGTYAAATLPIAQARIADPGTVGIGRWLEWAVIAGLSALTTLWIALCYATRPGRRLDPLAVPIAGGLFAWFGVALVTTIVAVAAGQRADPAFTWVDGATAPIATFSPFVVTLVGLGVVADIRAGARRARDQLAPNDAGQGRAETSWALAQATFRELLPGQAAAQEARLAAERTRLAGDLHATVLPELRRAIAEAEAGGDPDVLARQLRTVDLELERLMADRWPVVLEAFGLVAALEDLAERIEVDTALAVEIDVERAGERPPPAIERAAWRVAQLAIDNAARHAEASTVTVTVTVGPDRVVVTIADDGRGFDPAASGAVRAGARGLADAGRRAQAVGATIRIEPRSGGGTVVAFDWAARMS